MTVQPTTISPLEPVSGLGGFFGNLLNVFDKGADIYLSTQERLGAIKQIQSETVTSPGTSVIAPSTKTEQSLLEQAKSSLQTGSIALILASIMGIILLVMILKRKG